MTDIVLVRPEQALNGESPVWCNRREALFWVDMRAPCLHLFDPATGRSQRWDMPAWAGSCALTEEGDVLVALRTGLHVLRPETGDLAFLAPAPCDPRRFALNDGKSDPAGRFYVGPTYHSLGPDDPAGASATPLWPWADGAWSDVSYPVQTSNGLAWSPDGRTMYHSDTAQHLVWAYDYNPASGEASGRRVFAHVDEGGGGGGPDGAAMDRDGFYWCTVFAGSCLLRFDPDGRLERKIETPVQYPTMPAFGGPGLGTLFLTSASWPLSEADRRRRTQEGCLFALQPPVPGLPASRVRLPQHAGH